MYRAAKIPSLRSGIILRGPLTPRVLLRYNCRSNRYPDAGLGDHNFCRNPDELPDEPWCYNGEGGEPRWGLCGVPHCSDLIGRFQSYMVLFYSKNQSQNAKRTSARKDTGLDQSLFPVQLFYFWVYVSL